MGLITFLILGSFAGWLVLTVRLRLHKAEPLYTSDWIRFVHAVAGILGSLTAGWIIGSVFQWGPFILPSPDPRTMAAGFIGGLLAAGFYSFRRYRDAAPPETPSAPAGDASEA